jgi:HEAT repeat protein
LLSCVKRRTSPQSALSEILEIHPPSNWTDAEIRGRTGELLLPMLGDKSEEVRGLAALILGHIGFIEAIAPLQLDQYRFVRSNVVAALLLYGGGAHLRPDVARSLLKDERPVDSNWWNEAKLLAGHGYRFEDGVIDRHLNSSDGLIRSMALEYLSVVDSAAGADVASAMVNDSDTWVQSKVADVLGRCGSAKHFDTVGGMLQHEYWCYRLAALKVLTRHADPRFFEMICNAYENPNGHNDIRVAAVQALGKLGDSGGIELLKKAALEVDPSVAASALKALASLGQSTDSNWPTYDKVGSGSGNRIRITNNGKSDCRVGVRWTEYGTTYGHDLVVPTNSTKEVLLGGGTFDVYYLFSSEPRSVYKGAEPTRLSAFSGEVAAITLAPSAGGNYRLHRVG